MLYHWSLSRSKRLSVVKMRQLAFVKVIFLSMSASRFVDVYAFRIGTDDNSIVELWRVIRIWKSFKIAAFE